MLKKGAHLLLFLAIVFAFFIAVPAAHAEDELMCFFPLIICLDL